MAAGSAVSSPFPFRGAKRQEERGQNLLNMLSMAVSKVLQALSPWCAFGG